MKSAKQKYILSILEQIHFIYDHKAIRQELLSHMQDLEEELSHDLGNKENLEDKVILEMGDPIAIGQSLNQIHKPFLGYLWLFSKYSVLFVFIYFVFFLYHSNQNARLFTQEYSDEKIDLSSLFSGIDESLETSVSVDFDIHELYTFDQNKIILERVVFNETGKLAILYQELRPYRLLNASLPMHHLNIYSKIRLENGDLIEALNFAYQYYGFNVILFDYPYQNLESFELLYEESVHDFVYKFEVQP